MYKTLEDVIGRRSLSTAVLVLKVSKRPCQGLRVSSNLIHCSSTPKWLRLIKAILIGPYNATRVRVYERFNVGTFVTWKAQSKLIERALLSVEDNLGHLRVWCSCRRTPDFQSGGMRGLDPHYPH